jgi:hypothetical protein
MQFGLCAVANSSPKAPRRSHAEPVFHRTPLPRAGGRAAIASIARSRYIRQRRCIEHARGETMRAEVQTIVDEIKQSVGLLRRHL